MMTSTTPLHYRKTKQGEWVVFGPAAKLRADATVDVFKADGSRRQEFIERVGKPFDVDGVPCCYGYKAPRDEYVAPDGPRRQSHEPCANCYQGAGVYIRRDSSGLVGKVCSTCNHDRDYELSFA